MTLNSFEKKFKKIVEMGWIENKFKRNKNGGAGNTLEELLDIAENNLKTPDLGEIELKTTKKTASGAITLFTYDTGIWKIPTAQALETYGLWIPSKNRHDLYFTHQLSRPTSNRLITKIVGDNLELTSSTGDIIIQYPFEKMAERWNQKLKQSIVVKFKERKNDEGFREYQYESFKYHVGEMTAEIMKNAWKDELLIMETASHTLPSGAARNHGTKIRAKQRDVEKIYARAFKQK